MDKRLAFNEDAENYDNYRPRYCPELFEDIIKFSAIGAGKYAVEIGCGTGQATEPFLKTGCFVTAVEIGESLARYAREKFKGYENFKVRSAAFEDVEFEENSADLVFSATAFHWIKEEIGYPKVYKMLKKGGSAAFFWNHPAPKGGGLSDELQKIYARYTATGKFAGNAGKAGPPPPGGKVSDILLKYGFSKVENRVYKKTRVLDAKGYVSLLDTYSDHRSMEETAKGRFYSEVASAIARFGGRIEIEDTMDLYLGKKL